MSDRGYLDDVPLKLNQKFYPIPRPIFKEIDIHIPIDALEEDYDFTHERKVLEDFKIWEITKKEEEKKAEERRKKELEKQAAEEKRLKELAEAQSEVETERAAELERRRLELERLKLEEKEAEEKRYAQSIESRHEDPNETLMYQRCSSSAASSSLPSHHSPIQSLHRSPNHFGHNILASSHHGKFDYSDFEPDTANPFDNAEINSINEMAVLASVLDHNTSSRSEISSATKLNNVNYNKDGPGLSSCPTSSGNNPVSHAPGNMYYPQQSPNPYPSPVLGPGLDWRPEGTYYGHPVDNDLRVTNSTAFKKLYFPLLSSMASRERERNAIKALGPLPHHSQPQPTTLPVQSMSSPLLAQPPSNHSMPSSVPHSHSYIQYKPYNEEP